MGTCHLPSTSTEQCKPVGIFLLEKLRGSSSVDIIRLVAMARPVFFLTHHSSKDLLRILQCMIPWLNSSTPLDTITLPLPYLRTLYQILYRPRLVLLTLLIILPWCPQHPALRLCRLRKPLSHPMVHRPHRMGLCLLCYHTHRLLTRSPFRLCLLHSSRLLPLVLSLLSQCTLVVLYPLLHFLYVKILRRIRMHRTLVLHIRRPMGHQNPRLCMLRVTAMVRLPSGRA